MDSCGTFAQSENFQFNLTTILNRTMRKFLLDIYIIEMFVSIGQQAAFGEKSGNGTFIFI